MSIDISYEYESISDTMDGCLETSSIATGNTTPMTSDSSPDVELVKDATQETHVEQQESKHRIEITPGWTKNEILHIYEHLKRKRKIDLPNRSNHEISKKSSEIRKILKRLIKITEEGMEVYGVWTNIELATLIWLQTLDLTLERIKKEIPDKSPEQVRGKLMQINGSVRWTEPELKYIETAAETCLSNTEVAEALPIRTFQSVCSKLGQAKHTKMNNNGITKKTHEWKSSELKLIHHLIKSDLTSLSIEKYFPSMDAEEVHNKLTEVIGLDNPPFTTGEVVLLKKLYEEEKPIDDIYNYFPFRSRDIIREEYEALGKKVEEDPIDIRRKNFKSSVDELVYYAQWFTSNNFSGADSSTSSRRSRRSTAIGQELKQLQKEADNIKLKKKVKKELTEEEIEARKIRYERLQEIKRQKMELKKKEREKAEARRLERKALGLYEPHQKTNLKWLKEEADYFQSMTGNHKAVEEGETRKRKQTEIFRPEFQVSHKVNDRQYLKQLQQRKESKKNKSKSNLKGPKRKKVKKNSVKKVDSIKITEGWEYDDEEEDEDEDEEEKEESVPPMVSPYDPYDVNTDTQIPIHGRNIYIPEIKDYRSLPELSFVDTNEDENVMLQDNDKISYVDPLAAEVIIKHFKSYNDLPISFPPLTVIHEGEVQINPLNRVRLRFLLYPQHSELYILAAPKSNELDPVEEMQKLFQIHFCLYFSHSTVLKEIIVNDYCRELDNCVENNDFGHFMFVVDKWNLLMTKLSINKSDSNYNEDINKEIRIYLQYDGINAPTDDDLKLDIFLGEINSGIGQEPTSPIFDKGPPTIPGTPLEHDFNKENEPPINVLSEFKFEFKTSNEDEELDLISSSKNDQMTNTSYMENFIGNLNSRTMISRYCMQQILLRIYSRVVSPDSQKLRSYKAFTAEVYGELLPSFTSEVLTKVGLRPEQKFYDLGSGVGNTTFQAALEFGACFSGGCELMEHASNLTKIQDVALSKKLSVLGLRQLPLSWALSQSFVQNEEVRKKIIDCDVIIVNNYLFDVNLNTDVGRLLCGLKPGSKIISLRNFIRPRYKSTGGDTIFDYLKVEKFEMSDFLSVSWTANKVPYYISTVQDSICSEYL
ncbi:histone-lysine N-methyltransferase, H3 lysine-79 specific [[Candida] anglica]